MAYRRFAYLSIQSFCAIHLFSTHVFSAQVSMGPSMLPTIDEEGSILLIDKLSHRLLNRPWQRGDVVVSVTPDEPDKKVAKRIVAMEGDVVRLDPLQQQQANAANLFKIPKGHVWLIGDNWQCSNDSRHYGPVPIGLIHGRVTATLWPKMHWIT